MRERLLLLQVALAAGALVGALALAGCASAASVPTPTPLSPSATPFFASDEEALSAATAAYDAYLKVSDEIAANGGVDPSPLRQVVTSDEYVRQEASFEALRQRGLRATGRTELDSVRLERADPDSGQVVLYLCVDLSTVRIVDEQGIDQTPAERVDRQPIEATLDSEEGALLLARSAVWSGTNFC